MALRGETIGQAYVKILADGGGFADDVEREVRKNAPGLEKAGEEGSGHFHSGWRKHSEKSMGDHLVRLRNKLNGEADRYERIGERIGRAFGRGSRNDFLNAFGGFVAIGPKLVAMLLRTAGGLGGASEQGQGLKASLMGLVTKGVPALLGALAAAAVAIQVTFSLMGPAAAAVSLLSGLVVALAGSLSFAMTGGLVAVAGAIVPVIAAVGVLALGIGGLNKKTDVVKNLAKEFKSLAKATAVEIFGKKQEGLAALQDVLQAVRPLILLVAGAVGDLVTNFSKAATGKAFATIFERLGKILPPMVGQLSSIGGNLTKFVLRAFIAAGPIISQFLTWLDGVTGKLADMGKGGKKSDLADFFKRAWKSAKIVGTLVGEIAGAIGDLFSAGKGTGDSIFTTLTDKVKEFRTWLKKAQADGTLDQFFSDAKDLGGQLGTLVSRVIAFVDALDTPESRLALKTILDLLILLVEKMTSVATFAGQMGAAIFQGMLIAGNGVMVIVGKIQEFITWVTPAWNFLWTGLGLMVGAFVGVVKGFFLELYNWLIGNSLIPDLVMGIAAWFARLPGLIGAALGSLAGKFVTWVAGVPAAVRGVIGRVVAVFAGLAGKVITAAGNIASRFGSWVAGLPSRARTIASAVVKSFVGLASRAISAGGSIVSRFAGWVAGLPGRARTTAAGIVRGFSGMAGRIIAAAGSLAARFASWVAALPGRARSTASRIASSFSGLAGRMISSAGSIVGRFSSWISGVVGRASSAASRIVGQFSGLAGRIVSAIGTIIPKIKMPHIPGVTATGGVFAGAQTRIIAEDGPEAVVPLNRPLNKVDPAVRALSAFAQGMKVPGGGGGGGGSRGIDVGGITVITPSEDPRAVASEVIARMAAAAYI